MTSKCCSTSAPHTGPTCGAGKSGGWSCPCSSTAGGFTSWETATRSTSLAPILERVYGYARYLTIYVAAGIGGAFLSMTVSRDVSVGASGAIFGVAGAMLVTGYVHRHAIPPRWGRAFGRGIIPFIVLVLLSGLLEHGIDNWGHLGGLATGAIRRSPFRPHGASFRTESLRSLHRKPWWHFRGRGGSGHGGNSKPLPDYAGDGSPHGASGRLQVRTTI